MDGFIGLGLGLSRMTTADQARSAVGNLAAAEAGRVVAITSVQNPTACTYYGELQIESNSRENQAIDQE